MMDRETLEKSLNYSFKEETLLTEALTHKSFVNENRSSGLKDNERLEFLGDAVLDLVVSNLLFSHFPDMSEGDLSKRRASLVREETLAELAVTLDLGHYITLGKGESKTGGQEKPSLLADALEAIIAAVYLDGGMEKAQTFVSNLFLPLITSPVEVRDFKSRLQELLQERQGEIPKYRVSGESGPDHEKSFEVTLEVGGEAFASGTGKSIKEAEQAAAEEALKKL